MSTLAESILALVVACKQEEVACTSRIYEEGKRIDGSPCHLDANYWECRMKLVKDKLAPALAECKAQYEECIRPPTELLKGKEGSACEKRDDA